jgi:hypothetical protein
MLFPIAHNGDCFGQTVGGALPQIGDPEVKIVHSGILSVMAMFRQLNSLVQNYSMKTSRIEGAVLLAVGDRWTKVAKVIGKVAMGTNVPTEVISEHIEVLIRAGRLEAQGNTKNWRFSEVRRSGPNTHHTGVNE